MTFNSRVTHLELGVAMHTSPREGIMHNINICIYICLNVSSEATMTIYLSNKITLVKGKGNIPVM